MKSLSQGHALIIWNNWWPLSDLGTESAKDKSRTMKIQADDREKQLIISLPLYRKQTQ
jgi:hypothetical protein